MRHIAAVSLALILGACETSGGGFNTLLNSLGQSSLTNAEIDAGLRQALEIGTTRVSGQLGAPDGFFGDDKVRIPLPGRLGELQSQLTKVGLSGPLDDLQLRMNRAASAAMPEAKNLMISAVRSITLEDAVGILRGDNSAATDFLRRRTEVQIKNAFAPHINNALAGAGAFQALDGTATRYGLGNVATQLKSDMTDHAVNLGLNGMFFYVAEEERKIRENPVARTTELLRRVFGS